jgi:hypothetical protein
VVVKRAVWLHWKRWASPTTPQSSCDVATVRQRCLHSVHTIRMYVCIHTHACTSSSYIHTGCTWSGYHTCTHTRCTWSSHTQAAHGRHACTRMHTRMYVVVTQAYTHVRGRHACTRAVQGLAHAYTQSMVAVCLCLSCGGAVGRGIHNRADKTSLTWLARATFRANTHTHTSPPRRPTPYVITKALHPSSLAD